MKNKTNWKVKWIVSWFIPFALIVAAFFPFLIG